jgi:DNA-binding MarR family transcriptional regulator
MSSTSKRTQLTQELLVQFRYVSANSVMFSQAVAEQVGIHSTDTECLDFLLLNGPATAGQLAAFTGLTTGAVTAMIDRLTKAGYVQREHDQADRRRVIVIPDQEKIYQDIAPHSMPMGTALEAVCAGFSEDELEIVARFITQANAAAGDVISQARKNT